MILSLFTACSSSSTQNCQPNGQGQLPPGCSSTGGSSAGGYYRSGGSGSSGGRISSPSSGRSGFGSFGGGRAGG
ncbi:MAG: hypothetical protein MUC48_23095 [Leptolyngbya sp. Prado105]|nr:hypothetical protein [Leptolyngbya sp. Prado105]